MEFARSDADFFPPTPCALQQSAGYARALQEMGALSEIILARDGTTLPVAKMHVVSRRIGPVNVSWLPRGPVWAPDTCPDLRAQILRKLPRAVNANATWIISPDTPEEARFFPHLTLMSPQHVAEIDLTADLATRLAVLHGKWRNRLRHAQRSGLRVTHRPFKWRRDTDLLAYEALQRRRHRYRALPPEFIQAWEKTNPRDSRLFTVSKGKTTLAHMLVLLHKPAATYHIGWSGPEGRHLSAHNLALWDAMTWLAGKGYQRFDLGSVDTQNAPGLARFKIGSGARIRPLGPTCLTLPRLSLGRSVRRDAA